MAAPLLNEQHRSYQKRENVVHTVPHHEAHQGFLHAGKQGYSRAAFELGNRYLVAKDTTKALCWYQRAAKAGHANAQYNVGLMWLKGAGVPRDVLKGLTWMTKAADRGDDKAQALLQRIDEALLATRRKRGQTL